MNARRMSKQHRSMVAAGRIAPGVVPTVLLVAALLLTLARPVDAQSVWELTPYRVQVFLQFGRSPELTPALRATLAEDLVARAESLVGSAWDIRVQTARAELGRAMLRDLESVTDQVVLDAARAGLLADVRRRLREERAKGSPAESAGKPPAGTNAAAMAEFLQSLQPQSRHTLLAEPGDEAACLAILGESLDYDKVVLLAIVPQTTGYRVQSRELDVSTRTFNSVIDLPVFQTAALQNAALRAVRQGFAALARIVEVEDKQVTLRLRAVGFRPRDPSFSAASVGMIFRPLVRKENRNGEFESVFRVPWTYLDVRAITGSTAQCRLYTGLRTPLSSRRRGRTERLALAVVAPDRPTRLTLKSRTDPDQVLVGYDVYAQRPGEKATTRIGRTDRRGSLLIPPAEQPLRILYLKNGEQLLGRLPMMPGLTSELEASLADDDLRLSVEGFLIGLREDLIDIVTHRAILMAQIRGLLRSDEIDEVRLEIARGLLDQLQLLKTRQDFLIRLNQKKKTIFTEDRAIQDKIDAMFLETEKILNSQLDSKEVSSLASQLRRAETGLESDGA